MASTLEFQPQRKTVLSREIYHTLRDAILGGTLEPGARLVEGVIANQMRVSRAPLREAIHQLERDGLVKVETGRETRVVSLTCEDIRELHLIRGVLETLLYQYAAKRLTPEEIAELNELANKIETSAAQHDAKALAKYDYEFHERLCFGSGLPRVTQVWYEQHILFRLWLNVVARAHDSTIQDIAASHRAILSAIQAQDDNEIARLVHHHIYFVGPAMAAERADWAKEAAWFFFRPCTVPESSDDSLQKAKKSMTRGARPARTQ